jgi:predicted phosphoadenosine phosphosulfate sulfurtransferase
LAVNNNGQFQDVWKLSASSEQISSKIYQLYYVYGIKDKK